jgi:hypothetical protein
LGNIVELNDLYPRDIFPNQQEQRVETFKPIYDPDMFSGVYSPLQYTFDTACIGVWVRGSVGKRFFATSIIAFYDSNGRMVYWREPPRTFDDILVKSHMRYLYKDTFYFLSDSGKLIWKKFYSSNNSNSVIGLNTSHNGLVRILKSYNEPYTYTVQHIGPQGYDFGYDPEPVPLWHEEDSLSIWFNAEQGLSVHPEMNNWRIQIYNTLGQLLINAIAYDLKKAPLGIALPEGVYIVEMLNPQTGKVQFRKLWKYY